MVARRDVEYEGPAIPVRCIRCGWRSTRAPVDCGCDDKAWCYHTYYGTCIRCGGPVYSADYVRDQGLVGYAN